MNIFSVNAIFCFHGKSYLLTFYGPVQDNSKRADDKNFLAYLANDLKKKKKLWRKLKKKKCLHERWAGS